APLAEVAPDWSHPVLGLTPAGMIEELRRSGGWTRAVPWISTERVPHAP
ncbi:MAG: hypothetical protein HY720_03795, partial [Planctomycetes bacterium]|nr:hypothetical protein [Planctomycetota bacterium]